MLSKRVARQFLEWAAPGHRPGSRGGRDRAGADGGPRQYHDLRSGKPCAVRHLIEMLNRRVTPVVQSRGSLGEADLAAMANVLGTMGGAGDAYYQGRRMSAAAALAAAGLKPLQPSEVVYPSALISTNAYSVGQGALLVHDAKLTLDWADLILAMDLEAMNSSVTPLTTAVQANRPFKYSNLEAARVLDMIKGSYLFDDDAKRIIQDPESQRASFSRQGAAWKAWSILRDSMRTQLNSSDHNPAVKVQAAPEDSWELDTPQLRKYFVKGGPESHGQHGFILSNANWDPYPMANEVEALTNALANMDVAVVQRIYRFSSTFFTVIAPKDVLDAGTARKKRAVRCRWLQPDGDLAGHPGLAHALTPEGNPISNDVEELQAQTVQKVTRARRTVDDTLLLLGRGFADRDFLAGRAPCAGSGARLRPRSHGRLELRSARPSPGSRQPQARPQQPIGNIVHAFMTAHPAAEFQPALAREIDADSNDAGCQRQSVSKDESMKYQWARRSRAAISMLAIAGAAILASAGGGATRSRLSPDRSDRSGQDDHADRARLDHRAGDRGRPRRRQGAAERGGQAARRSTIMDSCSKRRPKACRCIGSRAAPVPGARSSSSRAILCRRRTRSCSRRRCWRPFGAARPTRWRVRKSPTKRWCAP